MKCGLLGKTLSHSYSPQIHASLGDYAYALFSVEEAQLEDFLIHGDWQGLNVTIPYKKAVIPYLDALCPIAQRLGAVNTIVYKDGKRIGHNTDYYGFQALLTHSGFSPAGKKCIVLGSGGASAVVQAVLEEMGGQVVVISRSGENHYGNLHLHSDARILVNATPLGMYPENGISPVDLTLFPQLEGVLDLIYNPARTQLLMDAERRGIPGYNGLWMLVAQAKEAAEWFTGHAIEENLIPQIHHTLSSQMENIVLIGMPGCGKTSIGQALAEKLGKPFFDSDALVEEMAQKTIPRIFAEDGEAIFRQWETKVLSELGKQSGMIIATGGGAVTQSVNYRLLRQNSRIFWVQRALKQLPIQGRPLSQSKSLDTLWQERADLYGKFADHIIENNGTIADAVHAILEVLK